MRDIHSRTRQINRHGQRLCRSTNRIIRARGRNDRIICIRDIPHRIIAATAPAACVIVIEVVRGVLKGFELPSSASKVSVTSRSTAVVFASKTISYPTEGGDSAVTVKKSPDVAVCETFTAVPVNVIGNGQRLCRRRNRIIRARGRKGRSTSIRHTPHRYRRGGSRLRNRNRGGKGSTQGVRTAVKRLKSQRNIPLQSSRIRLKSNLIPYRKVAIAPLRVKNRLTWQYARHSTAVPVNPIGTVSVCAVRRNRIIRARGRNRKSAAIRHATHRYRRRYAAANCVSTKSAA